MNRGEFGSKPSHYSISDAAWARTSGSCSAAPSTTTSPTLTRRLRAWLESAGRTPGHCAGSPERLAYVEGIVRRGPDQPWEMHRYALDREAGHVMEATPGYERSEAYRAWCSTWPQSTPGS